MGCEHLYSSGGCHLFHEHLRSNAFPNKNPLFLPGCLYTLYSHERGRLAHAGKTLPSRYSQPGFVIRSQFKHE